MKVNQLKKMLSVTLAAAMLVTSIPLGSSAGETDATEATAATEATEAVKSEDTASNETAENTGAENKEVPAETTPAPSENVQDPSSGGTEEQNTQPSAEESNGSNSAQEASVDNAQSALQEGEPASNSENSTGEKEKENTPAKTSTIAPIAEPGPTGATEVTLVWKIDGVLITSNEKREWDNAKHTLTVECSNYEGDSSSLGLSFTTTKDGSEAEEISEPGKYIARATVDSESSVVLTNFVLEFEITKKKLNSENFTWWVNEQQQTEEQLAVTYTGQPIGIKAKYSDIESEVKEAKIEINAKEPSKLSEGSIINAGDYTLTVNGLADGDGDHYEIAGSITKELTVDKCALELTWADNNNLKYDGTDRHKPFFTITHNGCSNNINKNDIEVSYSKKGEEGNPAETKDHGTYVATASLKDELAENHIITDPTHEFTIKPYDDITLEPSESLEKVYDNKTTIFTKYTSDLKDENLQEELYNELKDCISKGTSLFTYDSENVGKHDLKLSADAIDALGNSNFDSSNIKVDGTFVITPRQVTITPNSEQWKYYGAADPVLTYEVDGSNDLINTNITEDNIRNAIKGLFRTEGEDVGKYKIDVPNDAGNFTVKVSKEVTFEIKALPVTITPDAGQGKLFGQEEPESYPYTVKIEESALTNKTNEDVEAVLGIYGLTRVQGEGIGQYNFQVVSEDSPYFKEEFDNYEFKVSDTPTFEIRPIEITDVQKINSRQDSFKVETDLTGDRQPGVTTGFKVEIVEYPEESDGINYSKNIDDYITDATSGVLFTGASDRIDINVVQYSKERKDNKKLVKWNGYLPAGTKIAVSVVDAYGNQVSNKKTVTVSPVTVSFDWSGYTTSAVTGNYLTENRGVVSPLTLTGSRTGEWAEIVYNGKAADYGELNLQFAPKAQNANSKHVTQTVTANIVDTLNLVCESKSVQFYVDDSAFPIPASSIRFENRGKEIVIQLPEQGTLTEVSILDGKVELPGSMGQEFTLPVNWSGRNLIPSGAPISVTYTDQAGHQGTGITSASRSSVSTPITFRIRPELNMNGYLNGRSDMLIVSGTACSCEPIRITVAGSTQTTYATQKEVWSDSNGSWEAMFSMGALPEDQDFTISAEYVDVNGQGYSISAKFDAFCASPSVVSPVYEAMSYISGMVEPGTAVALVLNGDSQNYYEIQVDRFGHFVMDDVPMMFGGEDSFDIYVTDIAGNVSIRHYEVEEPGDPFEVTGKVNPLGKFLYSASENDSITLAATPVSADDFDENKTDVEIPLLMGMSYEVGTLTLHKTASGFTVSKEIKVDEEIAAEDYRFENEKLYVYTSRPSVDELKSASGQEAAYGAEIPLGEGETVWIVSESDMTILADDVAELKQFDFENSEEYAKYQEK